MDVERIDFSGELEYVGFWPRLMAAAVDGALLLAVPLLLLWLIGRRSDPGLPGGAGGAGDLVLAILLPLAGLALWSARHASPGKLLIHAVVLDEKTAGPPSMAQQIGRYLACFLGALPFGIGILWIAFDRKKQGWHDKLAGTIVVRVSKPARHRSARFPFHS